MGNNDPRQQPQRPVSRMSLSSVHLAKPRGVLRMMLYATEGLGKTTFASHAPAPIFLAPENGFPKGVRPPVFPTPKTWREAGEAVGVLINEAHDYKSFVIDTMDWLLPLLYREVCAAEQPAKNDIEDFDYGKGYEKAANKLRVFLGWLDTLHERRGMNIIMLQHAEMKTFKNPAGPDYDRFQPKGNPKMIALLKEWPDILLFGTFKAADIKTRRRKGDDRALNEKGKIVDAAAEGARIVYTTRRPHFDAKNRHNLPHELPFDWDTFIRACSLSDAEMIERAEALRAQIVGFIGQVRDERSRQAAEKYMATCRDDIGRLSVCMNKVKATLMQQAEADVAAANEDYSDEPAPGAPIATEPPTDDGGGERSFRDDSHRDDDPDWMETPPAPASNAEPPADSAPPVVATAPAAETATPVSARKQPAARRAAAQRTPEIPPA